MAGKYGHEEQYIEADLYIAPDEYLFGASLQIHGMSGGPCINGWGYSGLVHANILDNPNNALVIPRKYIIDLALTMQLQTAEACNVTVDSVIV